MGNILWLATLGKSLLIFACKPLPDGTQYLVAAPTVTCWENDHQTLVILATITFVSGLRV